jgi:hypothetical protein
VRRARRAELVPERGQRFGFTRQFVAGGLASQPGQGFRDGSQLRPGAIRQLGTRQQGG